MNHPYATLHFEPEALYDRTLRLRFPAGFATLLFLAQGNVWAGDDDVAIEAPSLCFWPEHQRPPLSLKAGGRAQVLGLSDSIIVDAIGARSESVHLRMLIENPFRVPLGDASAVNRVGTLLAWFSDDLSAFERQSPMAMSAYLRLVLLSALRLHTPEPHDIWPETTTILRRFRHLVELHYRDHWQVARYADELAIDYDRLNRICKRETGRNPAELIHERLTAEAKARLENTGLPLKRIAADLGFADPTRFSHFFKRRTEISPGAYRAIVSRPDGEDLGELRRGFSDWP